MKLLVVIMSFFWVAQVWAGHSSLPLGDLLDKIPTFEEKSPITPQQAILQNYTPALYEPSQGFSDSTYWHKITLTSAIDSDKVLLNFNYNLLEKLDFYLFEGLQLRRHWQRGSQQDWQQTDSIHSGIWIPIILSKEHTTSILIRKQGHHPLITPIKLYSEAQADTEQHTKIIAWALVLSAMLALLTHNLFVFFLLRYPGFFYYLALNVSLLISLSVLLGFNRWLFHDAINHWLSHYVFTLFGFCAWMLYRFSLVFLQDINIPNKNSWFRLYGDKFFLAYLAVSLVLPSAATAGLMTVIEISLFACCTYWGVKAYQKGFVAVRFYIFSWLVLVVGSLLSSLVYWRLFPVNLLTEMILPISCIMQLLGFSFAFADKAKQVEINRHLHVISDPLTKLPNRFYCFEKLPELLTQYNQAALVMIEVSSLAKLSQAFGPNRADATFAKLTTRLNHALQVSDQILSLPMPNQEQAYIMRVSSNRLVFVSLSPEHLSQQIQDLQDILNAPIDLEQVPYRHQYKIGSALYPQHGSYLDELYKNVLVACDFAELPDHWLAYEPRLANSQIHQLKLITLLTQDIENGKLYFDIQPQVALQTGHIIGGEVLLRWKNATLGQVSPAEFIPIAEKAGLISQLSRFIIDQTFCWAAKNPRATQGRTLAINISAQDLWQDNFAEHVITAQRRHQVRADSFYLEVTETSIFQKNDNVIDNIQRLRKAGFKLAIDDFGTGYSSMQNLVTLDASELKIDKFFIDNILANPQSASLCRNMVNLSLELGIRCVAEGIESEAVAEQLKAWQCQAGQGYYFYRPMSPQAYLHEIAK